MRLVLVPLSLLATAGCSLIYNPSNIDKVDGDGGVLDMEIIVDADPSALSLKRVRPAELLEGQGVDGSRQALIVVTGENFVDGATAEILQHETGEPHPSITVDTANVRVDGNHKGIAIPVTVGIDDNVDVIRLDVRITQPSPAGTTTQTITNDDGDDEIPALVLRGLPQFEPAPPMEPAVLTIDTAAPPVLYSRINASSIAWTGTSPVRVRAVSSVTIGAPLNVSSMSQTPGPGGAAGGNGGTGGQAGLPGGGVCPGSPGAGVTLGNGSPGVVGTLAVGTGGNGCVAMDGPIASFATNVSSGGGGGGSGSIGGQGRPGGGGGGAVEITAGGNLTVGDVTANGGPTTTSGGALGGTGAGGVILLRAGGTITTGTLTALGGAMGPNVGKIRFDNPGSADLAANPPEFRGPMLAAATPLFVTTNKPVLSLVGTPNADVRVTVTGFVEAGPAVGSSQTRGPFTSVLNSQGTNTFTFPDDEDEPALFRGTNTICVEVLGAGAADEGRNCLQMTYLLPPP